MTLVKLPEKKFVRLHTVFFLLVSILLIVFGINIYQEKTKIIPEELLTKAINNTLSCNSYRFKTKSTITIAQEKKEFSNLTGEKAGENTLHVTGSMLGTEINVYQIKDTTYRMDPITKKWIVTENNPLIKESLLMAELNPLSNFHFKELISASYLGKEKINKRKLFKLECVPQVKNKWLDNYFTNLKYTIWVDKKAKIIKKAKVTAQSKENSSGSLTVEVELYDHNDNIKIIPPTL